MWGIKGQTALEYLLIIAGAIAIAAIAVFVAMGSLESSGEAVSGGADVSAACQKACIFSTCRAIDSCLTDCLAVCSPGDVIQGQTLCSTGSITAASCDAQVAAGAAGTTITNLAGTGVGVEESGNNVIVTFPDSSDFADKSGAYDRGDVVYYASVDGTGDPVDNLTSEGSMLVFVSQDECYLIGVFDTNDDDLPDTPDIKLGDCPSL